MNKFHYFYLLLINFKIIQNMKFTLLNLPIPEPFQKYQRGNHQLFADYMERILNLKNINDIEIIKLSRDIIDRYNNQ